MLMQLRKCANHPYLFEGAETPPFTNDERLVKHSGKLGLLDKLLLKLHKGGHRVLIFSQMTRLLDILEDYCAWREWQYCRIDGGTPGELRDEQMEAFNAPKSNLFLFMLSTRAGGLGINLATADTVILFDSDWNPQMDLQAMDRAHRIGQTKPVVVYRLITEGTVEEKIVERAQRKLYLDAAVIQQGRLAEQSKALTKDEILSMVRFGADAVFDASKGASGKGGKGGSGLADDLTEADLDALLARGEENTRRESEKMQSQANSLANFSLGGEEKSLYEYEGTDWSQKGKHDKAWALSLPKRVTKQNYDENEYYRNALHGKDAKGAPKPPKPLPVADFQFFDMGRLEELRQVEWRHYEYRKAAYDRRYAPDGSGVLDEAEMQKVAPPLTPEQQAEKEGLLAAGFTSWSRKDLSNFVRGLEEYGRDHLALVATYVDGKSEREVAQYAVTFFRRYDEIKEGVKLMRRIEAGEARIARRNELDGVLARKIEASKPNPYVEMAIDYDALGGGSGGGGGGGALGKSMGFTPDNDRCLLCLTAINGYGRWEALQKEVRSSWLFKYDWFMKTRTSGELGKRVEGLAKLLEAEQEAEARAPRPPKRARAAAAAGAAAAGRRQGRQQADDGRRGRRARARGSARGGDPARGWRGGGWDRTVECRGRRWSVGVCRLCRTRRGGGGRQCVMSRLGCLALRL